MGKQENRTKYERSGKGKIRRLAAAERSKQIRREARNKPCMDCKKTFHFSLMDFDHRPGEIKLFGIGTQQMRGEQTTLQEIAKCDVLCCLCHRVRTWNRTHPEDQICAVEVGGVVGEGGTKVS